ncbi:MAG: Peptidase MA superfamily [Idiomarinaceae bacterium HL-53]|nr:MAG: Peptidase MA superfamily [Idiomarinaceae bacterium HL-53]CUS49299.1 Peptidase MA superfamily [Idiomarinaceae bacterium HL-53]
MSKLFLAIICLIGVAILSGTFIQRHALACEFLPFSNYAQIQDDVFIDSDFNKLQREVFKSELDSAIKRITETYGALNSSPFIVATSSAEEAKKWGANATATMHRMPWRACIVIGPEGQNVDVIAHEWLHAEIMERVGFFRFLSEIPVWFDEGVALTVDHRAPFRPENIEMTEAEISRVRNHRRGKDFFSGNVRRNYQAARMAVEPLVLSRTLYEELERINAGESFTQIYALE